MVGALPILKRPAALASLVPLLFACGGSSTAPSHRGDTDGGAPAPPPIVVALGDSLTAGPGLRSDEAYPALLQQRIRAAGYPHTVLNAGVSGDTSSDALLRVDEALVPNARVLVVALGANDGLRGLPTDTMRANLATIIERAQARDLTVLLCGMETPPSHGWAYTLDFHRVFPALAAQYNVPLMPFLLTGVAGNPDFNLGDRVHPNAAGMRRIAENMWPYLEPLLR